MFEKQMKNMSNFRWLGSKDQITLRNENLEKYCFQELWLVHEPYQSIEKQNMPEATKIGAWNRTEVYKMLINKNQKGGEENIGRPH